jgi:hypothetical protein
MECPSEHSVTRRAEAMSHTQSNVRTLAFKRSGDPNLGEYSAATILKTFGDAPENLDEI